MSRELDPLDPLDPDDRIESADDVEEEEPEVRSAAPGDDEIRALVSRLARQNAAGDGVVERATLLAEGADFNAVMAWVEANGGVAEVAKAPKVSRGLHGGRDEETPKPLRFIIPAAALA